MANPAKLIEIIRRGSEPLEPVPTELEVIWPTPGPAVAAVLFDVYGTLFISASGDIGNINHTSQRRRISQLLEYYGVSQTPEQLESAFVQTVKTGHEQLKGTGIDFPEVRYEEIWATVLGWKDPVRLMEFATAYESIVNPVYPMPGLAELLEALKLRGIAPGIISNAQFFTPLLFPAFLDRSLEELGFEPELCFYSFALGYAKPSLHKYLKARGSLVERGVPPESVLYIGNDMLNDILPAKKAGFRTLLFAGDKRSLRLREKDDRLKGVKPDGVITQLLQIISCI